MRRKTNEQFLIEMKEKHPTLTPLEEYKNQRTKILIHCEECGYEFKIQPVSLIHMNTGCAKCSGMKKKTTQEFVEEMKRVNSNIHILGEYINSKEKILVECNVCGHQWKPIPNSILRGRGCPKCAGLQRKTQEEFVSQMYKLHPKIQVIGKYINNYEKVKCLCLECNNYFYGIPHSMLDANCGCPLCKRSNGEKKILNFLHFNNIPFKSEYSFNDCRDKHALPFDFYIPSLNTVIEYDGKQHYEPNEFFGGESAFLYTQKHDEIKNKYCVNNNINMIRIPYWDYDNIEKILETELEI